MIDTARLIRCGVQPTQAKAFASLLVDVCRRFEINSVMQQAGFIAQAMHESAGFSRLEENLYYSTPERVRAIFSTRVGSLSDAAKLIRNPQGLANTVYANREGNGGPATGDGWRYRGRGLFQLTLKNQYRAAADALGRPYLERPELVSEPADAALSAGWYWAATGCNAFMSSGEFDKTTRRINTAMAGARERSALYATCQEALR